MLDKTDFRMLDMIDNIIRRHDGTDTYLSNIRTKQYSQIKVITHLIDSICRQ